MAIETLGRTHNFVPIANGTLLSLKDYAGVTFYCEGDDEFTLNSAETYDGDTTNLAAITDYYTNASTAGADKWVDGTQAAADSVTIGSGVVAFFVDAADLPADAEYVSVTHSSAGLVYAVLGDLLPGRDPANLRPVSGASVAGVMADTKISVTGGETGGPAESADETTEFLRKDGVYTVPASSPADSAFALTGGSDTSAIAAGEGAAALTSATAAQLSTETDVMLYIGVKAASTVAVAIGPDDSTAITILTSVASVVGVQSVRVPKGWYVSATFTSADVTLTKVPC